MKLVTIGKSGEPTAGVLIGDEVLDFALAGQTLPTAAGIPRQLSEILDMDRGFLDVARALVDQISRSSSLQTQLRDCSALTAMSQVELLAPLPRPTTVFSHGQAYHSHARDWNRDAPAEKPEHPPAGFIKSSQSVIGPGASILLPKAAPDKVDFEGEFSVVFGRECYNVSRADAMDYVVGYTLINDVSARDWVASVRGPTKGGVGAYNALNILHKNFPTFCPMGPNVTTKDEIADYHDLRLTTRLNDEVMQEAGISELIWDIPELIEFYSGRVRFLPGDVMSTGTPGGVGAGRTPPRFMKAGDRIRVSVEGIGDLENVVTGPLP